MPNKFSIVARDSGLSEEGLDPEAKLSATNLIWHIGQTVRDLPLTKNHPFDWSLSVIEKQMAALETLDAIYDWLCNSLGQYIEDFTTPGHASKNSLLITELKQLIEKSIDDQNLSTKMLSNELGLSVNYIRSMFKTETIQSTWITSRRSA